MAKKKTATKDSGARIKLLVSHEEAGQKLRDRIAIGNYLLTASTPSESDLDALEKKINAWREDNINLLRALFTKSRIADNYPVSPLLLVFRPLYNLPARRNHCRDSITKQIEALKGYILLIESLETTEATDAKPTQAKAKKAVNKRVFIVHGHDKLMKLELAELLREHDLKPVILQRQPDEGLTVIEKFEKHANVDFAFILATPDEVAYLKSEHGKQPEERKFEWRPRPNVVFEYGYFMAKLGRGKVCLILSGEATLPSDLKGVIYKECGESIEPIEGDILKDLKAAGYSV